MVERESLSKFKSNDKITRAEQRSSKMNVLGMFDPLSSLGFSSLYWHEMQMESTAKACGKQRSGTSSFTQLTLD